MSNYEEFYARHSTDMVQVQVKEELITKWESMLRLGLFTPSITY